MNTQKLMFADNTSTLVLDCVRHTVPQMYLEIKIVNMTSAEVETMFCNVAKLQRITAYTPEGIWLSSYDNYCRLESIHKDYDVVLQAGIEGRPAIDAVKDSDGNTIQEAVEAIPAVPEVRGDVATIILLPKSDMEQSIENLNIAMAALMGV